MALLFLQLVVGGYLMGLIWTIQWVHYPLLVRVPTAGFTTYLAAHQRRIVPLVLLPMLIDLATGAALPFAPRPPAPVWLPWAVAVLAGVPWLSTAFVQVPLHGRLAAAHDALAQQALTRRLVATNWVRTWAWTAKFLLVSAWLWLVAGSAPA